MTRKKVKLSFITNDSSRKATYKKRKKGLMKKVSELSTLCGIDACAIVYSPYESMPEVWPADPRAAQRVIAQFRRVPEMEQSKKMVNQESFIRGRIAKAAEQIKKLQKDNREKEITHLMYQCLTGKGLQGLAVPELNDMGWLLDQNLKEIGKRIEMLKKEEEAPPPLEQKAAAVEELGGMERAPQPMWLSDWIGNPSYQQQMAGFLGYGGGGGDGMMLPFSDGGNHHAAPIWSNSFFP
ncbi:agamous-like MADS-box protein AGL80 [Henckelia pumila]|uniref:agamous-like MADS-box protein AGL80 n=1 Tax=Henckelia pumila TaxID=405737 RepID=UPI003C6E46D8